ncbi:endonuclease domain-containing protein [Microbacterium sp. RD1]|uniref:endonuclease domain-containing protein n=1 Tax=Microbacterium sp. RD1 TaxID=3457313 RepID=UPI003FA54673
MAAVDILAARYWRTIDLLADGWTRHQVRMLVAAGRVVRVRKGRYTIPDLAPELLEAARLGGRLDCLSLLSLLGVFVRTLTGLHVQFDHGASRLPRRAAEVVPHWRPPGEDSRTLCAGVVGALAQAVRCQSPRDAVATLDSAWHLGLVGEGELAAVFALLPRRYRALRPLLNRRSESGPETLLRLMLRAFGCDVEVQVDVPGVGRVDLIVDGWLIIECDSRAFHEGWKAQVRDRRRDLAAAALGYTTIRPLAEDILYRHDDTVVALRGVVATRPPAKLLK